MPLTEPRCSARTIDNEPCDGKPNVACPRCLLVVYCSDECRKSDWGTHRKGCGTVPTASLGAADTWENHDFWAEYPATDVLNLAKNEGEHFSGELNVLLLGDTALRHLIYTVTNIPETAMPTISVTINETDTCHLARTIFTLFLLTNSSGDPVANAEAAVHLWYSAKLPNALLSHMEVVAASPILTAMDDVQSLVDQGRLSDIDPFPIILSRGSVSMMIDIDIHQWHEYIQYLRPSNIKKEAADICRLVDNKKNAPTLGAQTLRMSPSRVAGFLRWRADGLLLPYGHPRDEFDTYNPVFFNDKKGFPPGASAEPLGEWPMEQLLDYPSGQAQNDVYGKMFYFVRDMFLAFQKRVKQSSMEIRVTATVANKLNKHFSSGDAQTALRFDRIEFGKYWDQLPFLALVMMTDLLRHKHENPHATLLTMSSSSAIPTMSFSDPSSKSPLHCLWTKSNTALDEYAPPLEEGRSMFTTEGMRRNLGARMWTNWDQISDRFLTRPHFFESLNSAELVKRPDLVTFPRGKGLTATEFLGIALRARNAVTRRWPNRVVFSSKDRPGLRNFNRWIGWAQHTPLRWLEWEKIGDISQEAWNYYHYLASEESNIQECFPRHQRTIHNEMIQEKMRLLIAGPSIESTGAANASAKGPQEASKVSAEEEADDDEEQEIICDIVPKRSDGKSGGQAGSKGKKKGKNKNKKKK
ncbi:hypothetical protein BGZ63DRAFT_433269 [Mariannaea sp. PMI_226]|nr:hypothetical protein BGZ63DRAFT_433269 [Mariannaea sp. PMI_226]